ncbi:DUF4192 domain-containing protein [Saccharothrix lopnurensis]|uniref:DUF4192 domain-containing protein n=1 Tax=Saccharothrix lopnurensis TaxID=1670621 RepID=A0ABW1PG01_9PSEU
MSDPTPEPTSSTSRLGRIAPVALNQPGDLIAAVPHLLHYYPADAVVANVFVGDTIEVVLCSTLPPDALSRRLVEQTVASAARHPGAAVVGVLVGGVVGGGPVDGLLPHAALAARMRDTLAEHDVPLRMFWTEAITAGARWYDYHDPSHTGTVPDPKTSVLAAISAVRGRRTFDNREDLAATLRPDPHDALARRARLIDNPAGRSGRPQSTGESYRLVMEHVKRTEDRSEALSDQDVADLAVALSDKAARDACLATAAGDHAQAAERLWSELTRQCPAPECAEPATLLAVAAYVRGDGVLASLALDRAEAAFPGHRFAELLRAALDSQMHPDTLRLLVDHAVERVERMDPAEPA